VTVAALFVQRDCAGGAITGLRFFHLRGQSSWQVPHTKRNADDPLATIVAAADWTVEQLKNAPDALSGHLTVVLDAQGSTCQWLATPSADDAAIKATVRDALTAAGDDEGGATLSWLADATPGADTSVQGLSDSAVATAQAPAARQRLALVSVADLPARVLLDELDKRDIVVRRVCSIWHAMALAWDPAAKNQRGADDDSRVVAASEPVGAVVTIDPSGALTWSWSQRGTLIAGGTLALRKDQARVEEPADRPALRLAGAAPVELEPDTHPGVSVIEVVRSDIGRLASDWIGWSVQLGLAPARITVIGPDNVTCSGLDFDLPEMSGVAAVGAGLGKHWPGASVQATVDQDAAGRTLQRLMDMENGVGVATAPAAAVDPRLSLTELSSRPGAADRKLFRWAGLALLVAAGAVVVVGWQVGRAVGDVRSRADALRADQEKLLKSVAAVAPLALKDEAPEMLLKSKRIEMEKARADQKDEEPILAEAQRVLLVLATVPDVRLKTLQINSLGILSRFELSVPLEGDQGPTVKDKLGDLHLGSKREVKWDGRHVRTANAERRDWTMAGQFVDVKPKAAPTATPPGAAPKPPASPLLDTGPGAPPSPAKADEPAPESPAPSPTPAAPDPAKDPKAEPAPSPAAPSTPPALPPAEPKKGANR
jgi:hypothetical protein